MGTWNNHVLWHLYILQRFIVDLWCSFYWSGLTDLKVWITNYITPRVSVSEIKTVPLVPGQQLFTHFFTNKCLNFSKFWSWLAFFSTKVLYTAWFQMECKIYLCLNLTNLPLDKMAAFLQTIFSNAFSWLKKIVFWLTFCWSLFLRAQLTITQQWFR